MQARAKHDAWVSEAQKYVNDVEEAKGRYIEIAKGLGWEGGKSGSGGAMGGVKVSMMAPEEIGGEGESSKLHEAVIDEKGDEIERIVKSGIGVNAKDEYVSRAVVTCVT
jgi:hypothetical protein